MKWIDYREKLGIGFDDNEKFQILRNKICLFFNHMADIMPPGTYREATFIDYFIMVGELPKQRNIEGVLQSMSTAKSIAELVSKYIAFSNTAHKHLNNHDTLDIIKYFLPKELDNLNIQYKITEDTDGFFIFPQGAKELDDALVSEPLEWLSAYPNSRKTYITALKQYSEDIYIRDTADNLRKALETFLQEFLNNDKNLETNKNEICKYLGQQSIDGDIGALFQQIINSYKKINDKMAKHNDKIDKKLLEFLLYQTGVLIRMVLVVKQSEQEEN